MNLDELNDVDLVIYAIKQRRKFDTTYFSALNSYEQLTAEMKCIYNTRKKLSDRGLYIQFYKIYFTLYNKHQK
jgi:hypothetical protein